MLLRYAIKNQSQLALIAVAGKTAGLARGQVVVKNWETWARHAIVLQVMMFVFGCLVARANVRTAIPPKAHAAEGHAPVGNTVLVVHLLVLDHANRAATMDAHRDSTVLVVRPTVLAHACRAATRVRMEKDVWAVQAAALCVMPDRPAATESSVNHAMWASILIWTGYANHVPHARLDNRRLRARPFPIQYA